MKKLLLATSALVMTAGFASAEITFSGDARMGIINDFGASNVAFTSRARIKFTLSGETDSGLAFGANFRADNASNAAAGKAGEVFVSGTFGKLTMGDIDGAAQQAVGQVDGVGLTGVGDINEAIYIGAGDGTSDPTAAYEYTAGSFTGILSVTNPAVGDEAMALGLKYAAGNYTFALGYEKSPFVAATDVDHVIVGVGATFGAVALKANYGQAKVSGGASLSQYHLSATYTSNALAVTAFYGNEDDFATAGLGGKTGYGLGASYDLGGGAKVVGGYAKNETLNDDAFDLGLSFSF